MKSDRFILFNDCSEIGWSHIDNNRLKAMHDRELNEHGDIIGENQ